MSFQISKNKMTFLADSNEKNLAYSNAEDVYIAHDSHQVIGEVDVSGAGINHFIGMVHLHCPGVAEADMPECRISAEWDGSGETTDLQLNNHMGPDSGQSRGSGLFSFKDTLTKVTIMLLPNESARNASQPFTIPASSEILFCLSPQDAVLNQLSFSGPAVPPPPPTVYSFTATQIMYNIVFSGSYEYIGAAVMSGRDDQTVTGWLTGSDPLIRASDGLASDYGMYRRTDGHYVLVFKSETWGGEWTHVYPGDATGDRGSNLDGTPFTTLESVIQAGTLTSKWGFSGQTQQFVTSASDRSPYKKLPAGQSNKDTTVTEVVPGVVGGFTLSNTSGYYDGQWFYAGNVRRVGPSFASSTDIGIYRHDYGADTYVLYYYSEGVSEAPTWALTKFGNNTGANAISPTHDFLSVASMTGAHIQYITGTSQTVNGTQYPPSNTLGGTMTIG